MFIEVDECSDSTLNNCDANAQCVKTPSSFTCLFNNGYTGNCVDLLLTQLILN